MLYDELHQRYGAHIAKRVQQELAPSEFSAVEIDELVTYLEVRAETTHKEYQAQLHNPLSTGSNRSEAMDHLCRRWRAAEDLAYLLSVAENVSATVRMSLAGAKS